MNHVNQQSMCKVRAKYSYHDCVEYDWFMFDRYHVVAVDYGTNQNLPSVYLDVNIRLFVHPDDFKALSWI